MEQYGVVTRSKSKSLQALHTQPCCVEGKGDGIVLESRVAQNTTENRSEVISRAMVPPLSSTSVVRNISEQKSGISSRSTKRKQHKVAASTGKSHSKHSKCTSRRELESQIEANNELLQLAIEEQEIARRKIDLKKKLIESRLALQQLHLEERSVDESNDLSTIDLNVLQKSIGGNAKVEQWLDDNTSVKSKSVSSVHSVAVFNRNSHSEKKSDPQGNEVNRDADTLKIFLARQCVDKDLPMFSGDIKEWINFYMQFRNTTDLLGFNDSENICRLRRCLVGEARRSVEGLLVSCTGTEEIMRILQNRFGRPELIVKVLIQEVKSLPFIKTHDFNALALFSDKLQNLVSTLKNLNMKNYLTCPQLLEDLLCKLPYAMQVSWGKRL
ncbi:uncharacterized protein LOC123315827 [Coccinella septempunctata]|uniref:uncharacterized protein LOC123315827 n=1 Tax=Coccinella septempunctata TaxID=41139 RepID=UPI001D0930DF|nr:uncharacterized protein LOC123315827 [Coccinella septempunctata]